MRLINSEPAVLEAEGLVTGTTVFGAQEPFPGCPPVLTPRPGKCTTGVFDSENPSEVRAKTGGAGDPPGRLK